MLHSLLEGEEHRNPGAVLARIEDLDGLEGICVKSDIRCAVELAFARGGVETVLGAGNGEGREGVIAPRLALLAGESRRTGAGQRDFLQPVAFQVA